MMVEFGHVYIRGGDRILTLMMINANIGEIMQGLKSNPGDIVYSFRIVNARSGHASGLL